MSGRAAPRVFGGFMSIEEELARRLKERLTLDISVQTVSQGGRTWIILEPADLLPGYRF